MEGKYEIFIREPQKLGPPFTDPVKQKEVRSRPVKLSAKDLDVLLKHIEATNAAYEVIAKKWQESRRLKNGE